MINDKRTILKILKEIQDKKVERFQPAVEPGIGVHYKNLDSGLQTFEEQTKLLQKLEEIGIVRAGTGMPILKCNSCYNFAFSLRFICNYCNSQDVKSGTAIEHDSCHNIDFEDKYLKADGSLKCEKCNKTLKAIGMDYSKINVYRCMTCNGVSSDLEQQYTCLTCGNTYFKAELLSSNIPDYMVYPLQLSALINDLEYMLPVVEELDRVGIKTMFSTAVVGVSGTPHTFDLVAYDEWDNPVLILETLELFDDTKANTENLVLSFIGKCSDFRISNKILVTLAGLPDHFKNLLKINKITVLEMQNKEEFSIEIVQMISDLFNSPVMEEAVIKSEK
jgi:phage FluMu protein Com